MIWDKSQLLPVKIGSWPALSTEREGHFSLLTLLGGKSLQVQDDTPAYRWVQKLESNNFQTSFDTIILEK